MANKDSSDTIKEWKRLPFTLYSGQSSPDFSYSYQLTASISHRVEGIRSQHFA